MHPPSPVVPDLLHRGRPGWRLAVPALLLAGCAPHAPDPIGPDDTGTEDTAPDDTGHGDTGADACPGFEVLEGPEPAAAAGPLDSLRLAVTGEGGSGWEVALTDAGSEDASLVRPVRATVDGATVSFEGIEVEGAGRLRLSVDPGRGCPIEGPLAEVLVGSTMQTEAVFLPTARLGVDFGAPLPAEPVLAEPAPPGLEVTGPAVVGSPEEAGVFRFAAAAWGEGGAVRRLLVHLAVLPRDDADLPSPAAIPSEDGPWPVDSLALTIPTIHTGAGTLRDVAVRVAYPSDGSGAAAEGRFAAVAFHHAAHSPATIYDRYTDLHDRLASHGLIVASVDASAAISGTAQSWENLWDLSTVQLALVDLVREDPGPVLEGHVDPDRVFVSGHSRGGAASLISLWRDPGLNGAVCYEPVSPIQTPSQDWTDPEANGDRPYPVRPILLFAGSLDADEPWPLVDTAWEQTVGPSVFVTLMGANHEDTLDADTPGYDTSASTIPVEARHDLDQHYTVAFLARFGALDDPAGDLSMERPLFGPEALSSDLSEEGVAVHVRRYLASALAFDDFQGDARENLVGGANAGADLDVDANEEPYAEGLAAAWRGSDVIEAIGDWAVARHLAWSDPSAELWLALSPDGSPLDLSAQRTLVLRVQRDCPPPGWGGCPDVEADFDVVLRDASGHEASVPVSEGMGDLGVVGRFWQSSLLPLDAFAGVDLAAVTAVVLRFDLLGLEEGDLWVDDLGVE